jgi:hypothetical protein
MASGFNKKKTLREKANSVFKKLFVATALVGAVGGAGYYEYGTIQEQDVKITSLKSIGGTDNEMTEWKGYYTFTTDKGNFVAKPSLLHGQSQNDANDIWNAINHGGTYRVKTSGMHVFGSMQPNILEVSEISPEELEARAKEKALTAPQTQKNAAQGASVSQQPVTAAQPQAALSGAMVTLDVVVNGNRVQLTMPVEAAGKVTVNTVTPLVPAPRAPRL